MKLHVATVGCGPDLVLLHGWGLHSGIWAPLLPALSRSHRVSCIDLPGHGHSPAPPAAFDLDAVAAAVAAHAPPEAAWLGWSLGGQVALAAALAGHAVRRLVLVATTPRFVAGPGWDCGMAPATLTGFADSLARDHRKTVRDFLALQLRGDRRAVTLLGELRGVLAQCREPDPVALRAGLAVLAEADLRARLPAIRQPALVISGARDRLTPAAAGQQLAAGLADGRFIAMPGAAHAPFLSHPEEFLAAVTAFLAAQEAAA